MKRIVGRTIVLLLAIVLVAQVLNVMPVRAQTASVSVTPDLAQAGYPVLITGKVIPEGIYSLQISINEAYQGYKTFGPIITTEYGEFQLTYVPSKGVGTYSVGVVISGADPEFPIGSASFDVSERASPGLAISGAYGTYGSAAAVVQKSDGGYAIAGTTNDGNGFVLELGAGGEILYTPPVTFGGTDDDTVTDMILTTDGDYVVAGNTRTSPMSYQAWSVKIDAATREVVWSYHYGDPNGGGIASLVSTGDGYVMAGSIGPLGGPFDFYLIKTDLDGTLMWQRSFAHEPTPSSSLAFSITTTSDGGLLLAGDTSPPTEGDVWLVKTDSEGILQWDQTYEGAGYDYARSVIQTSDGGFAIGGYTVPSGGGTGDFWLGKIDSAGELEWDQTYGGGNNERAYDIVQTSDGGFVLVGEADLYGYGDYDAWIVRTDSSGNVLWSDSLYWTGRPDLAKSVILTSDGAYAVAGTTDGPTGSEVFFFKTTSASLTITNKVFPAPSGPNVMDWTYELVYYESTVSAFSLPAAGDGSITLPELAPGVYWIVQNTKYPYDTTVTVDGDPISVDVYNTWIITKDINILATHRTAEFSSRPYGAEGKSGSGSSVPATIYNVPCLRAVPVQASWDPNFKEPDWSVDLVRDKPMTVLVNLTDALTTEGGGVSPTDDSTPVTISISFPNALFPNPLPPATTTGYKIKNVNNITIINSGPPSALPGVYQIACEITSGTYSSTKTTSVTVKESRQLNLRYIRLSRSDYGSETDTSFNLMAQNTYGFVNDVLPTAKVVHSQNYTNAQGYASTGSDPIWHNDPYVALCIDCEYAEVEADLTYGTGPNTIGVAIGPYQTANKNYFKYHGITASGKTAVGVSFGDLVRGVVVMDGYYSAVAHEIGHTFDLYYPGREQYEDYNPGIRTSGYSPTQNAWRFGTDIMGLCPLRSTTSVWVNTPTTYSPVLTKLKTPNDPQVLIASGIIFTDDTVGLPLTWYSMPYGTPDITSDTSPYGRFAFRFTTTAGIVETRFEPQFFMNLDPGIELGEDLPADFEGFGCIPMNFAGFAVAVEYPAGTTKIELIDYQPPAGGDPVPIAEIDPTSVVPSVTSYFKGFRPPINSDGSSIFKLGSVVPVKFQLQEPQGEYITDAVARISYAKLSNGVAGDEMEATTNVAATTGNLFRYDLTNNQYIFNLNTKSMSKGTWQLKVTFEDQVYYTVQISLK